jgi:hypothetical protein
MAWQKVVRLGRGLVARVHHRVKCTTFVLKPFAAAVETRLEFRGCEIMRTFLVTKCAAAGLHCGARSFSIHIAEHLFMTT